MNEINFAEIEEKWQKKWDDDKIFEVKEDISKKKYYILEMFPYPSAAGLHMGHTFNYTIGDIIARYRIMSGYNVMHPGGFDSLGLPAENAAIKNNVHPEEYTNKSIKNFIKQQKKLGISYNWNRCINTADSDYYKWDQWIFLKMFEKGLAYQKESAVNWCPNCNTVLANEQAQGGYCDRCDSKIEIKQLKQWFLKITDYADRLLDGHSNLNWPEKTIAMQKNWIGKSYGNEIIFKINDKEWKIFTTRPDTVFGVTFMVISAQHKDLMDLVSLGQKKEVLEFLDKLGSVSEKELAEMDKLGVFTGSYAINPANGEKVPVYAGNFVVADYGSGMVMAVPAHDQRDFDFAKKYGIKMISVIESQDSEIKNHISILDGAYTGTGKLINSGDFNGLDSEEAKDKIFNWLKEKGIAKKTVNYRLRDWCISRQRYWGTPIPLVDCKKCGFVPVSEKDLPVKLPKDVVFGVGNPLLSNKEWLNVKCPICGENAKRITDTMDTFVNSSWYFLRFCDPNNKEKIFDKEKVKYWMPVDLYIGGAEHACMHLLFHRFFTMFLHDIGVIDFEEPTPRLFHQGMINDNKGEKMSKSKGNVVEPLETIAKYGADTTRFFMVSEASPDKGFNWSDKSIQGSLRFTKKIMNIFNDIKIGDDSGEMSSYLNKSIKDISEEIESIDLRKATINLRNLYEKIVEQKEVSKKTLDIFFRLIAPFCPHIAEELWENLGHKEVVSISKWPEIENLKIIEKKKNMDINLRIIEGIKGFSNKFESENKKIYVYVMPFEIKEVNKKSIESESGFSVEIYSVNDSNKYDPENRAKKAKPGMPSFYWISGI